jgi:hypothetical protein
MSDRLQDNPSILSGYRVNYTWSASFASFFRLHNGTLFVTFCMRKFKGGRSQCSVLVSANREYECVDAFFRRSALFMVDSGNIYPVRSFLLVMHIPCEAVQHLSASPLRRSSSPPGTVHLNERLLNHTQPLRNFFDSLRPPSTPECTVDANVSICASEYVVVNLMIYV